MQNTEDGIKLVFIGKQGAGKTTALNYIGDKKLKSTFIYFKFAGPIYYVLRAIQEDKHRLFMQEFSDLVKKHFGKYKFLELAKRRFDTFHNLHHYNTLNILCDDCRFLYEFKFLMSQNFIPVFIDCNEKIRRERISKHFQNPSHNSETEVDTIISQENIVFFYIPNNGTLKEFYQKLDKLYLSLTGKEE